MGGIKYFANKEKRTVVAKIDNIQNDILAMLKKMCKNPFNPKCKK